MDLFTVQDCYWHVAGDAANVYGSKRNIYVPTTDTTFTAWLGIGNVAGSTESEAGIWHLMQDWMPLYLWDGTNFSQPGAGAWRKTQLQNYNALVRFNKVTGGIVAAGVPIQTDDRSRGFINAGRLAATDDPTFTTRWYGSDGNFYSVDAAQMIQMSNALGAHTNGCYTIFDQVAGEIQTNTVTTLAQIDSAYASALRALPPGAPPLNAE
jgi:hypothetical protein